MMGMCYLLFNTVALSHRWPLSPGNVASATELNFECYLILTNFILKSHMQLVAAALRNIGQHRFQEYEVLSHA